MSQVLLQTSLESAMMFLHENSANSLAWEPTLSTFGRTTSPWTSEGTCCSYFSRISPSAEPPMRPVWEILQAGAPRHSLGPSLGPADEVGPTRGSRCPSPVTPPKQEAHSLR